VFHYYQKSQTYHVNHQFLTNQKILRYQTIQKSHYYLRYHLNRKSLSYRGYHPCQRFLMFQSYQMIRYYQNYRMFH